MEKRAYNKTGSTKEKKIWAKKVKEPCLKKNSRALYIALRHITSLKIIGCFQQDFSTTKINIFLTAEKKEKKVKWKV